MEKVVISNDIFFAEVLRILREGKNVTIPVKGVSMLPFIRGDRDSVELEPLADARPLAVGDIVLFRVAGRYILHRIIQLDGNQSVMQGDGAICREHCPTSDIFGRVVTILKKGRIPINPYTRLNLLKARIWHRIPLRRYLLAIYRRFFRLHA